MKCINILYTGYRINNSPSPPPPHPVLQARQIRQHSGGGGLQIFSQDEKGRLQYLKKMCAKKYSLLEFLR